MYATMAESDFDPVHTALVESPLAETISPDSGGTAKVVSRNFTEVVVHSNADAPALLVLAEAYYPGWKATVNGTPANVVPVYSIFRGVVVPSGNAEVRFEYSPTPFRIGLACSVLSLLAGASAAALMLRRAR
jgi:uncharacterized membrane protein YfhO